MKRGLTGGHRAAALCGALFAFTLVVAACSSGAGLEGTPHVPGPTTAPTSAPTARPGSPDVAEASATPAPGEPTAQPTVPMTLAPSPQHPWLAIDLRDVRTGETIRPADLIGKVVVIEPMAVWCSNCRAQQNEARTALANLASADLVYISLDIDPNETETDLAQYADERGYPWHFAVASRDLARALAAAFGDTVLSPPSTPKIVIAPDGTAEVSFGIKSAADLEAELGALLP